MVVRCAVCVDTVLCLPCALRMYPTVCPLCRTSFLPTCGPLALFEEAKVAAARRIADVENENAALRLQLAETNRTLEQTFARLFLFHVLFGPPPDQVD